MGYILGYIYVKIDMLPIGANSGAFFKAYDQ